MFQSLPATTEPTPDRKIQHDVMKISTETQRSQINTFFFLKRDLVQDDSALDFPGGMVDKNLPASARHTGSILGLGRFYAEDQLSSWATTTEASTPHQV